MSNQEQIEAKYQAELKRADIDHHKPTAGAMSGHIVANLWYFDVKLHQALWYLKGEQTLQLQEFYTKLIEQNRRQLDELAAVLLDENELPPSTVAEYTKYTKLSEDARFKYMAASEIVATTAQDFVTADMFIDRAIILAQREHRPALAAYLTEMRGYNNRQTRQLQALLGKTAWEGLVEVDDDDDDD